MYNNVYPVDVLEEAYDEHFEPTETEILEQCKVFGINPSKEPEFVYIAKEALKAPLPANWKAISTQNDDIFYFDSNTGESTWMHPCDTYYENLLLKEREKKAASIAGGSGSGGLKLAHRGAMKKPASSSSSGSVGQKQVPDLPSSPMPLPSNKPQIFGPTSQLEPLEPLPSIKPLVGKAKKPLPSLKVAPPLGQPPALLNQSKAPPLKKQNLTQPSTPKSESSVIHTGSDEGVKSTVAGSGDSTLIVTSSFKPPVHMTANKSPTDLDKILQLSNHYEEENESNTSNDDDDDGESLEEETSFGKKYNLMGMEDLVVNVPSHTNTVIKNIPTANEKEKKTSNIEQKLASSHHVPSSSYFMKSSNPLQDNPSPSHTPMGSPASVRPSAARGKRTKTALTASLVAKEDDAPFGVASIDSSSDSGSISIGQVQGDLVKKHQEMIERIKQDHSKECEMLRNQFQQETKKEKEDLENEKLRKLSLIKEQFDEELAKEKAKIERKHCEKMEAIRKTLKEDEDDEEARLQEKKENFLRDIKRKLNKEQENEEEQLKNAKEKALADLRRDMEDARAKMEKELKEAMNETVLNLKTTLEQETEAQLVKLQNDKNKEIEKLKKELQDKLEKEKSNLVAKNNEEIVNMKELLSKEHECLLEDCRNEMMRGIAKQKEELEEQKLLQTAVEEEIGKSLEVRKKELEDKYKEEMLLLTKTHEENLTNAKQKYEQQFESVQAEWEQKISNLKMERNKELTGKQEEYEQARIELENKMADLAKQKEDCEQEVLELSNERDLFSHKKEDMQRIMKDLEEQIEERQTTLSQATKEKEGTLATAEKHLQRLNIKKDELLKEIQKLEAKQETLIKNVDLLKTEEGQCLVHIKPHPPATPHSSSHSSVHSPHLLPHQSPVGHTHLNINPISNNLIFQNPAANSTSLLDELGGGVNVTVATVKSDGMTSSSSYSEETVITSDNNRTTSSPISPDGIQQVPSLHLSDLHKPSTNDYHHMSPVRPHSERPEAPPISFSVDVPKAYYEPNNMWTKVKNQIEQEGQALLRLEEDFARGPVKRLQKIEEMLDDMNENRERQEDDINSHPSFNDTRHIRNHIRPDPAVVLSREYYSHSQAVPQAKLAIEDLETSSSSDSNSVCSIRKYSPQTQEVMNQSKHHRHNNPKQLSRDKVYTTLDRISGQLGQVIHRLNDREYNEEHHQRPNSDQTQYRRREFDKELHDKWQEYLDQAAKDDSSRQATAVSQHHSNTVFDPPIGKTKTDIAGQSLIQRQKDWLKEFKQSLPPLRGRYMNH